MSRLWSNVLGLITIIVIAYGWLAVLTPDVWRPDMGIVFVLAGIVGILIGVFGKEFYEGDALTMSSFKRERRVSNWWGRLIFIIVGASFIALGVMALFGRSNLNW